MLFEYISIGEEFPRAMSRCLPYMRPNYKEEDVSLIGSIKKLQIQWGNTQPRKLVSRKMKEKQNKKRSREEYDNLDSLQHKNKKRKAEMNIKFNGSCHYARKEDSDHLERSDLSEEHDPPALALSQSNSYKGSDPNKKRPGMVIRIKLPLKKHKDVEPESTTADPHCSSQVSKSFKAQAVVTDSAPYYRSSEINKTSKVQPVETESAPHVSAEITKLAKVQAASIETSPRCSPQVTKPSKSKSVLTESAVRRKEVPTAKQPETCAEPCFSGPVESRQRKRSGGGSCTQRSERQLFRDLIISWKPPPIQPIEADEGELDWLFPPKKPQDAKPSAQICRTGISDSSTCPSHAGSLQPRATYLPGFGMYQLPYVIPF